jgi:hypothetical protein
LINSSSGAGPELQNLATSRGAFLMIERSSTYTSQFI